jgi:hypothetical protein
VSGAIITVEQRKITSFESLVRIESENPLHYAESSD